MSRIITMGLAALTLAACQPAAQPAAPVQTEAPAAPQAETPEDAAWRALEDRYLAMNVQPTNPIDAVEWREVRCNFLAGEIGGDNSAQDRAVQARMEELRCGDGVLEDARALKASHVSDTAAVARLDALLARNEY
ncbi:hypothetical protein ACETK8_09790 [Brevundimonas staleyi]|uniref:Lipoprotein n=1 Tax=Brevundimonas staleyi TaxID=74326 RepID=A0ABW0FP45_9CAUL